MVSRFTDENTTEVWNRGVVAGATATRGYVQSMYSRCAGPALGLDRCVGGCVCTISGSHHGQVVTSGGLGVHERPRHARLLLVRERHLHEALLDLQAILLQLGRVNLANVDQAREELHDAR